MIEEQKIEPINSESKTNYVYLIPILMGITLAIGVWLGTLFIPASGGSTQIVETSNKFQTILEMID